MEKRILKQEKKIREEETRREKAHKKVMAKIAYKDWRQTKTEEAKLKKKQEKLMLREGLYD
jgi:hypothetical protein